MQATSGTILLIVGVILILVSAFAEQIGIGTEPGFGWRQTLGVVIGVAALVAGVLARKKVS